MPNRSFEEIGFACNPFRALTREEWIRAAVLPGAVRRAAQAGGLLQILGGTGSGKTTALLALENEFRRSGLSCAYEYIPPKTSRFCAKLNGIDVFFLDEAQRLSDGILLWRRERNRLVRTAKTGIRLILGSHENLTNTFLAAKMTLRTVRLFPPDAEELAVILERRLSLFELLGDRAVFSEESVDWLSRNFAGDLRTMEYFLYDFFQTQHPAGIIPSGPLRETLRSFTPPAVESG
jgi:chromosomal replication initiation ATPase DnaA